MKKYRKLGELIQAVDIRNGDLSVTHLLGVSIEKKFIPSVANTIGTDLSKYKVIHKNEFACSLMQVSRDEKLPVACLKSAEVAIMSPAYHIFKIRDEKQLLPDYLEMWFKRTEFDREASYIAVGGVRGSMPWEDFIQMELPVPAMPEQQKIVNAYNAIERRIQIKRKINEKLEEMAETIFKHNFLNSKILNGNLPKNWHKDSLGSIAKISSGKSPLVKQSEKNAEMNIPLIGAASVMGYTNSSLYNEKILVTGRVGTHGIVQRFSTSCWPSDNTLVVITPYYEFVYQILKNIDYKNMNRGSTQPLITQTDLKKIEIVLPEKGALNSFEEKAKYIFENIDNNEQEIQSLQKLQQLLVSRIAENR